MQQTTLFTASDKKGDGRCHAGAMPVPCFGRKNTYFHTGKRHRMIETWTMEQYRAFQKSGGRFPPKEKPADGMNKTERLFSWHLEDQRKQGLIEWWAYEPMTLVIVDGCKRCRYTPDFVTVSAGSINCYEIKGFLREAARIRFLAARERYPFFTFTMIRRVKSGWETIL